MRTASALIHRRITLLLASSAVSMLGVGICSAGPFFFSTGPVNSLMAAASRPDSPPGSEIESADDFVVTSGLTRITSATFTGLMPVGFSVSGVAVEIYRVFPRDSANPPDGRVPTRVNSPSDVAFADRDTASGNLTFTTSILAASFTAQNSVLNGINPTPNQTTGGEGPVTGQEVEFDVTFTTPIDLLPDHYFFIPQVLLSNGNFFWLSASKPIVSPGTAFAPDLQSWIRNAALDPDWLRIGTDIVGPSTSAPAPTFNGAFSVKGSVPEPGTAFLVGAGAIALWRRRRRNA